MAQKVFGSRPRFNGYQVLLDDGTVTGTPSGITGFTATSQNISTGQTPTVGPVNVSTANSVAFYVTTAGATAPVFAFEQSVDGTTWAPLLVECADNGIVASTQTIFNTGAPVQYRASVVGVASVRFRVTSASSAVTSVVIQPSNTTTILQTAESTVSAVYFQRGVTASPASTETIIPINRTLGTDNSQTSLSNGTPSSGRTFKITAIQLGLQGNTTTATTAGCTFRIRYQPASAGTSSPLLVETRLGVPATIGAYSVANVALPDAGFDIQSGYYFCVTYTAVYTSNPPSVDVAIFGYEYQGLML